ncbi:hypothetical protein BBJ28_00012474 [Nothophytophthora sp. Chile5]|nr:hypothetical protein BBJ28_00012474 [Nothophytophthora sp. Chile5]
MGTHVTFVLPNGYPARQLLMEELNQFLNSVEASARKILKQQNKKQQQLAVRDRVALARGSSHVSAATSAVLPPHVPSRDALRATYAAGGGPTVSVPSPSAQQLSRPPRSPSRSEHSSETGDDPQSLPRLPPPRSPVASVPPGSLYAPLQLPSLARKRKSPASALKLLESPLYKSLAKSRSDSGAGSVPGNPQTFKKTLQDVDNVALLLRKMGLHDAGGARSPAHRPDHAVEKRMCNACWAKPDKLTGCERHPRVLSPHGGDALTRITNLELQGPTSWLSDDLYVKYRSESDREALWLAYLTLKAQQQELEAKESSSSSLSTKKQLSLAVIPVVTRHPVCALFTTLLELENLRTQAETRKRNLAKTFVFDVNLIWLANLDHFNQRQPLHGPGDGQTDPEDPEGHSLRGRRDNEAIREGFSQIQSISSARALQLTVSIGGGPPQLKTQLSSLDGDLPSVRRRRTHSRGAGGSFRPLSLLVSGRWDPERRPNVLDRVPGAALVGHAPVLWWQYEPDHELGEEQTPEYTKAVALFTRNRTLSSSNGFLVSLVLALDTPVLSPLWFAWQVGSKMPPPELEAASHALFEADSRVLARVSPCLGSLLSSPLISILDELLPGTVALLNDVAQSDDHWLELPAAVEGHRRGWSEFSDRHLFRQWLLLPQDRSLNPRYDVDAQHCSVAVAHANTPGVCGRYCWHETEPVEKLLCRRRVEKDLVYILQNRLTSGPNDPTYFSVSLAHEVLKDVQGARLATYLALMAEREARAAYEKKLLEIEQKLEAGRLALEAKRQEQQRLEQELQATAAQAEIRRGAGGSGRNDEVLAEEWTQRLEASVLLEQRGLWQLRELTTDSSGVVFYYSVNPELPGSHRFLWEPPGEWRRRASEDEDEDVEQLSTARSAGSAASSAASSTKSPLAANAEAQAKLAHNLLEDEQFLQRLKAKLGLPTSSRPSTRATTGRGGDQLVLQDEDDAGRCDWLEEVAGMAEEGADPTKAALLATRMARLKLPQAASRRGEGWKRLKTSRLPTNFARRAYRTHTEGPRSSYLNQPNVATPVGLLDPTDCSPYEPPDFIPALRAHFVPNPAADLQEKQALCGAVEVRDDVSGPVREQDKGPKPPKESKEQRESTALLCARNNNLEGLELALDGGVDVNARDNHGNTLFILVCQQGNKRLAKFLLRRHADMNLQNLNGNTALHYLYEYKHAALAEYLKAKGAQDATPNSAGLTCYEGLSPDRADQL